MEFQQSHLLWMLLLALLPIIIHLLNRLRFRTVKWAAIMFLVRANKSSTRNARLRHWLILASRFFLLLFFIFAICRPLVGGWLGSTLAGKPETIILCLDRSASMETTDEQFDMTKREKAIKLWANASKEIGGKVRFVLIENVMRDPTHIPGPDALPEFNLASATDTAAHIPSLLNAAADYLERNPGTKSEIWLASDLQASNWDAQSRAWESFVSRIKSQEQDVSFRLMALNSDAPDNLSLSLGGVSRKIGDSELNLDLLARVPELKSDKSVRFEFELNGAARPFTKTLFGKEQFMRHSVDLPQSELKEGWGIVRAEADLNLRDNQAFYAFGEEQIQRAGVVYASEATGNLIQNIVWPDDANRFCDLIPMVAATKLKLDELGLLVWQGGPAPGSLEDDLTAYVEAGGHALLLPPVDSQKSAFGLEWGLVQTSDGEDLFEMSDRWEQDEGPFARTANGKSLPVNSITAKRRQLPLIDETWRVLASYFDGQPFLLQKRVGLGRILALTTLPETEWSDLRDNISIVPLIHRPLHTGSARLANVRQAECGEWKPLDETESWEGLHSTDYSDWRSTAGVYRAGPKLVALNRPVSEDNPEVLDLEATKKLFNGLTLNILGEEDMNPNKSVTTEIWRTFVILALLFLLIEGILLLAERPVKPIEV